MTSRAGRGSLRPGGRGVQYQRGQRGGAPQGIGANFGNNPRGNEESANNGAGRGGPNSRGGRASSLRGGRASYQRGGRGLGGSQRGGNSSNLRQGASPLLFSDGAYGAYGATPTQGYSTGQARPGGTLPRLAQAVVAPTTVVSGQAASSGATASQLASTAIVADPGSIYLNNNTPMPGRTTSVTLGLPVRAHKKLDLDDPIIQKRLDGIRTGCKVWVRTNMADAGYIIFVGFTKANITKAISEVQQLLQIGAEDIWQTFNLVQPAVDGDEDFDVHLDKSNKDHALLVFTKYDKPEPPKEHAGFSLQYIFTEKFHETFDQVAELMSKIPNEMMMRVHLGQLAFSQWKKGSEKMKYQGFLNFFEQAGHRGCLSLDPRFGDEEFAHQALAKVLSAPHIFEPASSTAANLDDTIARKFVILFIKGLRFELEIQESNPPRVSSTRVFHLNAPSKNLEINVVCPGRSYDWKLEVLRETGLVELRRVDIKDHVRLLDPMGVDRFPRPSLKETIRTADVERIETKSVWTFVFGETGQYFLDICLNRQFPDLKCSGEPKITCSLVVYGNTWDDETRIRNQASASRNFGEEHHHLFPPVVYEKGFHAFMAAIETVQKFFTEEGRGSIPGGPRLPQSSSSDAHNGSGEAVGSSINQQLASEAEEDVDENGVTDAKTNATAEATTMADTDTAGVTTAEDAAGADSEAEEDLISFEPPTLGNSSSKDTNDDVKIPKSLI